MQLNNKALIVSFTFSVMLGTCLIWGYMLPSPLPPPHPEPEETLVEYVVRVQETCRAVGSKLRRAVLAEQIADEAIRTMSGDRRAQEAAVLLVCIESRFDPQARSSRGAAGLTQIMPKLFLSFANSCGMSGAEAGDIHVTEINLRVGFCLFRDLLTQYKGNVGLALAAYNSGAGSPTTKKLAAGGEGHVETSGYLAKYLVLREKLDGVRK